MRLLNVRTQKLTSFNKAGKPRYAILSHTWGDDEFTFQQLEQYHIISQTRPNQRSIPESMVLQDMRHNRSWRKIQGCCNIARSKGILWVWIDTCCIDKSSSTELSEAINSMYNWYADADVCYAYLSDVVDPVDVNDAASKFAHSRWFTRGWTLQELIAPSELIFYSTDWKQIGYKHEMTSQLSRITGIDEKFLINTSLDKASIAMRMSWAAKRVTTRIEDVAYSLMGIFSVNMPMIYGEGEKAFIRLQEEIIKVSSDETIFAWKDPTARPDAKLGLLAQSPAHFTDSGIYVPYSQPRSSVPFSMTNQGMSITLSIMPLSPYRLCGEDRFLALLNCPHPEYRDNSIGITLEKSTRTGSYSRVECNDLGSYYPLGLENRGILVEQNPLAEPPQEPFEVYGFDIRKLPSLELGYSLLNLFISDKMLSLDPDWMNGGPDEDEKEGEFWGIIPPFRLSSQPEELACAFLFDSPGSERVLVSIGSISRGIQGDINIGFSAIGVSKSASTVGQAWRGSAIELWPPGVELRLKHHKVCVTATASQMSKRKHFYVDISITAFQTWIPRITIGSKHGESPASIVGANLIPSYVEKSDGDGADDIKGSNIGYEKRENDDEIKEESIYKEDDQMDDIGSESKDKPNTIPGMQSNVGDDKEREEANNDIESSEAQYQVGVRWRGLSGSAAIINVAGDLAWNMLRENVSDRIFEPGTLKPLA